MACCRLGKGQRVHTLPGPSPADAPALLWVQKLSAPVVCVPETAEAARGAAAAAGEADSAPAAAAGDAAPRPGLRGECPCRARRAGAEPGKRITALAELRPLGPPEGPG